LKKSFYVGLIAEVIGKRKKFGAEKRARLNALRRKNGPEIFFLPPDTIQYDTAK
jgi:hypothetical protein